MRHQSSSLKYSLVARFVLTLALAALLGLSLKSYSFEDWGKVTNNEGGIWSGILHGRVENMCGVAGAGASHLLIWTFGRVAAWLLPVLVLVCSVAGVWATLANRLLKWTFILVATCLVLTMAMAFTTPDGFDAFTRGGIVGTWLADMGIQLLGRSGTGIFLLVCAVLIPLYAVGDHLKKIEARRLSRPRLNRRARPRRSAVDTGKNLDGGAFPEDHKSLGNDEGGPPGIGPLYELPNPWPYKLPPLSLLRSDGASWSIASHKEVEQGRKRLEEALASFGVQAHVERAIPGPIITRYEVEPAPGVKIARIAALAHDLALALKALRIRVVAPIPGTGVVGIEVPNRNTSIVRLGDIVRASAFQRSSSLLSLPVGKDTVGDPVVFDLTRLPHLLIGGTTGSGKSSCINAFICGLLTRVTPQQVRLILIDPKRVELIGYEGIPHLLHPVVTDPKIALRILGWAVGEMERRYEILAGNGLRDIAAFNSSLESDSARMSYIVVIIDELADLMMTAPGEIEGAIIRLAQKARAVGIHLIVATQRPSKEIVTGVLKSNFPGRIAFHVMQKVNSNIILDHVGAEKLLGNGDMLFLAPGYPAPQRFHGAFIAPKEIEQIVDFWRNQAMPEREEAGSVQTSLTEQLTTRDELDDPMWEDAARLVILNKQGSTSLIQRRLKVGYARAGRLMDILEQKGLVGPAQGSKPREVLVDASWLQEDGSGS